MSVADVIARRGINEVLHFTTSKGLVGMLYKKEVLSRPLLTEEESLEFLLQLNSPVVRDRGWEDRVNLSISEININYFGFSQRWHPELRWAIAAFEPAILEHDDVYFTTTNNIYPRCRRSLGERGLEAMFADPVIGKFDTIHRRQPGMPDNLTTHEEAEVLYPQKLSTEFLKTIYVPDHEFEDEVHAYIRLVSHGPVEVIADPARFLLSNSRG